MKVAGSYTVPAPAGRAYELLQNPVVLAKCMPGCEGLDKIGEDEYAMRMKMLLGSMSGLFAGKVKISDANPPCPGGRSMLPVSVPSNCSSLFKKMVLFPVKKRIVGTPPIVAEGSAPVIMNW